MFSIFDVFVTLYLIAMVYWVAKLVIRSPRLRRPAMFDIQPRNHNEDHHAQ
jgi:hypothetical protein